MNKRFKESVHFDGVDYEVSISEAKYESGCDNHEVTFYDGGDYVEDEELEQKLIDIAYEQNARRGVYSVWYNNNSWLYGLFSISTEHTNGVFAHKIRKLASNPLKLIVGFTRESATISVGLFKTDCDFVSGYLLDPTQNKHLIVNPKDLNQTINELLELSSNLTKETDVTKIN